MRSNGRNNRNPEETMGIGLCSGCATLHGDHKVVSDTERLVNKRNAGVYSVPGHGMTVMKKTSTFTNTPLSSGFR
jgi:hypothetical protein